MSAAEFMQYRCPVGSGPSEKTCPRCDPERVIRDLDAARELDGVVHLRALAMDDAPRRVIPIGRGDPRFPIDHDLGDHRRYCLPVLPPAVSHSGGVVLPEAGRCGKYHRRRNEYSR
jgi:hypothetical protein